MCGHGTIGTVTFALEQGLVRPREEGRLRLDTPRASWSPPTSAGPLRRARAPDERRELSRAPEVRVDCPGLGELVVDVAYGGNFYAIVEPQPNYGGSTPCPPATFSGSARSCGAAERGRRSRPSRRSDHPRRLAPHVDRGSARPQGARAQRRVLWREGDRPQPCGTGTSARMAQLAARGRARSAKPSCTRASSAACSRVASKRGRGRRACGDRSERRRLGARPGSTPSSSTSAIPTPTASSCAGRP